MPTATRRIAGWFRIEDSTISDNVVPVDDSPPFFPHVVGEGARGFVQRTTFAGNVVTGGGGVADSFGLGNVKVRQSIIEGCLPRMPTLEEIRRASRGYNVLVSPTACPDPHPNDIVVADAMLGPLADNGGPTLTRMPQPGSPARDAGVRCDVPDQRDVPRTRPCDIGAVDAQ
jgi:hypothetical protein